MRRPLLLTLLTLAAAPAAAREEARPEVAGQRLEEELEEAIERYQEESREYQREVRHLIERRYEERRARLADAYEQSLREQEEQERRERQEAIARFEEFLRRYPEEPRYTPDVMFRLAELYYERSSDAHLTAMREYEDALRSLPPEEEPPPEPPQDFSPSIGLYRQLIDRFPDYRLNDGAWYLLGYCLEKQNAFEESRGIYQQLIARYPRSRFTTEAWVRIGEYYFDAYDEPDALAKAAEAYEAAVRNTSHPLYDKALYKLGWTYYRMDSFEEAVRRFFTLVDYYEAQRVARGDEAAGGDLREEALQYAAISFADERWGGLARARSLFEELGPRPYEAEVYRRLGDVWFDQTNHEAAISAWRLVLSKEPLAPDAPQLQQKIVQAYERDRRLAEAFTESRKLSEAYAPGSAWYREHERSPDVLATANDLAEKNLYASALYHHQQALVFKQQGRFEQARTSFEEAASAYARYLERFPRSKSAYEMEFYLAECLYNSLRFAEAARHYEAVRDSAQGDKYFAESAFSAVLSWQKLLEQGVKAGREQARVPRRSSERPEGEPVQPTPLTELEARLVAASDVHLAKLPRSERGPSIAYKAAEMYYAHDDFPEARRRFEAIVQAFPRHEVARFSTNLIVESFLVDQDWRSVEEVSGRLASNEQVIEPSSSLYKDLVRFKLAGRFKFADQLLQEGRYEEAAARYLQLVDEAPRHEFADKALNNAAVAHEKTLRFDSALKLYERIYREYPSSPLADAALFRVAVNAENSYDFDKAVDSYQKLVKDYPASKDREAALFNAARLLEGQQRYAEAAAAFLRYTALFPNAEDAPRNQFRAALILEKQEDWPGALRALEAFVRKFASRSAQVELVVEAQRRVGDAWHKQGREREALRAWESAAREFDKRGLKPDTHPLAADAAAYSRFQLAEAEFRKFDKLKIGGQGRALEKSFTTKRAGVKAVNEAYARVFPYKRLEWTLAALYRRGHALERFANTIIETPVPPDVKRLGEEAVVAYQDLLTQQTATLEDAAVESYAATLQEARKHRISNEWTKRTLESLHRFRPQEYPVLKEARSAIASRLLYPEGMVDGAGAPPRPPPPPPPTASQPEASSPPESSEEAGE